MRIDVNVFLVMCAVVSGCASEVKREAATNTVSLAEFSAPRPAGRGGVDRREIGRVKASGDEADGNGGAASGNDGSRDDFVDTGSDVGFNGESSNTEHARGATTSEPAQFPPLQARGPTGMEHQLRAGQPVVVESLIGQVSGRPLFADELLEPIADQLRQAGLQLPPAEFRRAAAEIVLGQLRQVVLNELFLAESEAGLTVQQKQGLLHFMRELQEKTIATGGGVRHRRASQLEEEEGVTLDEFMEARRNEILIAKLLNERVEPRVIVSWRDIEQEYERRFDEFNPRPTVTFRTIRLPLQGNTELIAKLNQARAEGSSFETLVEMAGPNADVRTREPQVMGPGGVSDVSLIDAPKFAGLEAGQTSEGIERGEHVTWWNVASIDQRPGKSLYDVQRQLLNELFRRRREEERLRYIRLLFERGIYDEIEQMAQRLVEVAILRYGRQ